MAGSIYQIVFVCDEDGQLEEGIGILSLEKEDLGDEDYLSFAVRFYQAGSPTRTIDTFSVHNLHRAKACFRAEISALELAGWRNVWERSHGKN